MINNSKLNVIVAHEDNHLISVNSLDRQTSLWKALHNAVQGEKRAC